MTDLHESEDKNTQKSVNQSYFYVDDESIDNEELLHDNEELVHDNKVPVHDNDISLLRQEGLRAINFSIPPVSNENSSRSGSQFGTSIRNVMSDSEDALSSSRSDDDG